MISSRQSPSARRAVAWLGSLAIAAGAIARPVRAAEAPPPALPADLRLEPPSLTLPAAPGATPWRALAEEAILLGIGMAGYAVTRPAANGAKPVPLTDKLRLVHGAWGFDADSLAINYVGHPVDGLFYYQVARGNRLGVGASLGLTLATATGWEFAEYQELVSVHDVISTTAGGVALGEAFTQLAAWLGQRRGVAASAARVLFQLPRAFHDHVDRAPPAPAVRWGVADVGVWVSGGSSRPYPDGEEGELRLGARARLVRADEVGMPGSGWRTLLDGNVTSLAAEVALGRSGLVGADVLALASLAGLYGRELDAAGDGADLLATLSFGFDYLRRVESVDGGWAIDQVALVRIPGAELVAGLRRGALRAELGLEAAVTLGGVEPYALLGRQTDVPGAPGVLRISGYYHGLGTLLAPRASFALGPVELDAAYRLDRLSAITHYDVSPPADGTRLVLEDERSDVKIGLTVRTGGNGARLLATWERRDRWGRAGDVTASVRDTTSLLGVVLGL